MNPVIPPVPYADPWALPFSERLAMLTRGSRRIAYFYEAANNSTFRYRAYNMAQVLNSDPSHGVSASYFFLSDYASFDEIADQADTLVICRSRYGAELSHLIAKFRARRRRILFDVDDLVFNPRYTHLLIQTLGLDPYGERIWDEWFAMTSRLGATLQLCDSAVTTNAFLAEQISSYSGLPTKVVPNFLNREQMEISNEIYQQRAARNFVRSERVTLGYFSGSPSHRLDYAIVEQALADLMREDEGIDLVVVGYIEPTEAIARLERRIQRVPFQDYVNLQRIIGSVDFNLMPLQSNVFTDCKSELKYFDAAAVGTVSIASPSYTYRAVIDHGVNGYIAKAHEWSEVMSDAIARRGQHINMIRTSRAVTENKFTWATQRAAIMEALDG